MSNLPTSALFEYLRRKSPPYYAKLEELRKVVEQLLGFVPTTFAHYTDHSIRHSEEIVDQLSRLLFREGKPNRIVLKEGLSAAEAYVLIASAYLHDIGMVVSEQDKESAVTSERWRKWISGNDLVASRWHSVLNTIQTSKDPLQLLKADVETRFLMAEFMRQEHAVRSASVLIQHEDLLGHFAFDDNTVLQGIATVCEGHGMQKSELEDTHRFQQRTDIKGEQVNLQFITLLLRIGDLLDMSVDRALPILFQIASPLPEESVVHWQQYARITHRLTTHDTIALTARCKSADEHRNLRDWCTWLVDEVNHAQKLMLHSARHDDWRAPKVSVGGLGATIDIQPDEGATYEALDWRIELDQEQVIQLLVQNVYEEPITFIRELIQNAADATRCRMYIDEPTNVASPSKYDREIRERYVIKVSLEERSEIWEATGEERKRQVVVVEDTGIGMNRLTIQKYFLQAGRSYYTSEAFKQEYPFAPTSQFGVGFLSVFAVANKVIVESRELNEASGIRLALAGPRNYIVVDRVERSAPGTRIEVWLTDQMEEGTLTEYVSRWCKRIEFPIELSEFGNKSTITAESAADFPDRLRLMYSDRVYEVRAFPIKLEEVEGEIYIALTRDDAGEYWGADWSVIDHIKAPRTLFCYRGVSLGQSRSLMEDYVPGRGVAIRADIRGRRWRPSLGRAGEDVSSRVLQAYPELLDEIMGHIEEHIRARKVGPDNWEYLRRLSKVVCPLDERWRAAPMHPVIVDGTRRVLSDNGLKDIGDATLLGACNDTSSSDLAAIAEGLSGVVVLDEDIYRERIGPWDSMVATAVEWLDANVMAVKLTKGDKETRLRIHNGFWAEIEDDALLGFRVGGIKFVNLFHPVCQWCLRVQDASDALGIMINRVINVVLGVVDGDYSVDDLEQAMSSVGEQLGLIAELEPPLGKLKGARFQL